MAVFSTYQLRGEEPGNAFVCYNRIMKQLSVIIPFYNAEKYIERCVLSVVKACEGVRAEILLINNNSTDKSLDLAKKMQKEYPDLVSMLDCKTPGAAAVRNFGVKKVDGKYIWFIDADDEITPDSAKKLLEKAEKTGAELVMMGAKRIYSDGHTDYLSAVDESKPDYKSRFIRYGAGPWMFIISRKWWIKNGFLFREGIIHEDMELMSSLILHTEKFSSVNEPLYLYYQNDDSVLHKKKWDAHAFDIFPALEGLYQHFKEVGATQKYHDELEWFFIWNLLIDSAKDFAKFPEGRSGFSRSREMLTKYYPTWRKNRFLREKPLKLRLRVRANYHRNK